MKLIDVTPAESIVPVYVEQLTELEQAKRDELHAAEAAAYEAKEASRLAAAESARAKLAELGLTEEEIAAL